MKSASSWGSSWQKTAMEVPRPTLGEVAKAAERVRPSMKLWSGQRF